jgi:hypothetical protein
MRHIKLFENFTKLDEGSMQKDGLEFAASHGLTQTKNFKHARDYKDGDKHEPLFSLFHYQSDWPVAGLRASYFGDAVPAEKFKEVAKAAASYLKTGIAPEPLLHFVAYLYKDAAPGGRSQGDLEAGLERIRPEFNKENKDLPVMQERLKNLIDVLKSWSTGTPASRLNLAVAVSKKTSYSSYAGSDFEKVYRMILESLRKNRVRIQPDSKIEVDVNNTHVDSKTISNSIGYTQVDINRWESAVTYTVDGKEYVAGSFENQSGYGRY